MDIYEYWRSEQEFLDFLAGFETKEKCRIIGHILVNKVPGDFHISYHARKDLYQRFTKVYDKFDKIDMAHRIDGLSFGKPMNQQKFQIIFKEY